MNWENYKNYLLSVLPGAKRASGGKEINCRCQYCPDSTDLKSAHMYISVPTNNESPSVYYCQKCGAAGFVNHRTLIEWGIYDKDIALELDKYNASLKNMHHDRKYDNDVVVYQVHNTITRNDNRSINKLMYINNRLKTNLSFEDLRRMKIVLNLADLLNENGVTKYTRDHNILADLDREFIGFLSVDNAFLNMRRTCDSGIVYSTIDKRYINYQIFKKFETTQRFYTIPTTINLTSPDRIKINIAEGPFDILSIFLNVRHQEPGIYSCVAGSNYMNTILYFLYDMKLPYVELHFYPDNDSHGSIKRMRYIASLIPDKSIPIYIHRNMMPGEKDFGVSSDKINESISRLS